MRRILVIANADAGSHDEDAVDTAVGVLREQSDVEVAATSTSEELGDLLRGRAGRDVVVAGGDGSLHAVAATLHGIDDLCGPTLGLIPLGTGNDFARGIGLPLDPARAADVILRGRETQVDVLVDDSGDVVVNAVHTGVGAHAAREAGPWKARLGKIGYAVGALAAGLSSQGDKVRVTADGAVLADGRRRVLQVGIGNGPYIGGGTALTPDADPTDGRLDVMVSFAVPRWDRLLYAVRLERGTHDRRQDVVTTRATHVEISGEPFLYNADGEVATPVRRRRWQLQAGAFMMMLPTRAQADGAG